MSESPIDLPSGGPIDLSQFEVKDSEPPRTENPPRRERITERVTSAPAKPVKEPASKPGEFVGPLEELYALAGLGVSMFDSDGVCGPAIANSAHDAAVAWDELAQKNPAVRRSLRKLTQGSAWGTVLAAHLPIAIAIAGAHMPKGGMPGPLKTLVDNDAAQKEKAAAEQQERNDAAERYAYERRNSSPAPRTPRPAKKAPVKRSAVNERRSESVNAG